MIFWYFLLSSDFQKFSMSHPSMYFSGSWPRPLNQTKNKELIPIYLSQLWIILGHKEEGLLPESLRDSKMRSIVGHDNEREMFLTNFCISQSFCLFQHVIAICMDWFCLPVPKIVSIYGVNSWFEIIIFNVGHETK